MNGQSSCRSEKVKVEEGVEVEVGVVEHLVVKVVKRVVVEVDVY